MKPFSAPVDDILFTLNAMGAERIPEWDGALVAELAGHFASFAEGEIAAVDEEGDRVGAVLENGRVRMPPCFQPVYQSYVEQGWCGLTAPEEYGGQGMGAAVLGVTSEIFSGANVSLQMVTGLVPGAVRTLMHFGTEEQKSRNIPPLASGEWLATMCLTEPGAGSDLSRVRTRAVDDKGWKITGEKIFISGGDQDMSKGVFHLILARTSDDGIKGLSLFLARSERDDGTRNAITVTRIEEKMGLHASPTCQLAFDGAEAELVGELGGGLKAMFTMMNHARLDVSLQGAALAARATDIARAYTAERVQGGRPINQHADVARMLDEMDVLAMGGRGIAHLALVTMETGENPDLVEALTPIAKVFCTDGASLAADLGIQCLGGYGYLQEYRMEQIARDARITRIYEGANGIHATALATRLMRLGAPMDALAELAAERPDLLSDWQEARNRVASLADPTPIASAFMTLTAELVHQIVWDRMRAQMSAHVDPERIERLAAVAARRFPVAKAIFNAAL